MEDSEVTPNEWKKAEEAFRLMAFRVYYDKTLCDMADATLRFATALIKSAEPIQDRQMVIAWYRAANAEEVERLAMSIRRRKGMPKYYDHARQAEDCDGYPSRVEGDTTVGEFNSPILARKAIV